jgi:hypothetical protein
VTGRDDGAPDAHEDAAWQSIVENFGERVELGEAASAPEPAIEVPAELAPSWEAEEEHYVPPPAPPITAPEGIRLLAWIGLFGVPAIALICIVLNVSVPSLVDLFFVVSFVASFGYLVATMDRGRDHDGWDDGAVL